MVNLLEQLDRRAWFEKNMRTQPDIRAFMDRVSDHLNEWQGMPIPLGEDTPLVLAPGHPWYELYRDLNQTEGSMLEVIVGGPNEMPADEQLVNSWYSKKLGCQVYVFRGGGKSYAAKLYRSPDRSMDRLTFWLTTIGAADAWDLEAEYRARATLKAMLKPRQWEHYELTGSFLETSKRSGLTYMFRRLRPTVVLSPRGKSGVASETNPMLCIAVLCLHPIGYYSRTWGGCMVPSDDVIAHLSWMRGDEAGYWGMANQHRSSSPEAGL